MHSHEHWLQLGRFGGGHGFRAESREHEESETRNIDPESEMDLFRVEILWGEEQPLRWGVGRRSGLGEMVREVELGSNWMSENDSLLIEMVAREGGEHESWKEGWPQPAENENGNGGAEVKGGHQVWVLGGKVEQGWDVARVVKNGRNATRKMKAVGLVAEEDGEGGGGGIVVAEEEVL